jgi:hypothetical protein
MAHYLRNAIEQVKHFYIKKIMDEDQHEETPHELKKLTVSELKEIYKNHSPRAFNINQSHNISKNKVCVRKYNI